MSNISFDFILKELQVDRKGLAKLVGVSIHTVNAWGAGKRNIPESTVKLVQTLIQSTNEKKEEKIEKKPVFIPLTDSEKLEYIYKTIQKLENQFDEIKDSSEERAKAISQNKKLIEQSLENQEANFKTKLWGETS
jgi:DNA-binding XRE family transcriptional regulator